MSRSDAGAPSLTRAELLDAFGQLRSPRDRVIFGLCFLAALRVGEACALDWSDVWTESGAREYLTVRQTIARDGLRGPTKSRRRRVVPIDAALADLLDHYRRRQAEPIGPVLRSRQANGAEAARLTPRQASRILRAAFRAAGLTRASTHSLRKSFTLLASQQGIELRVLRSLLGHSDLQATNAYLAEARDYEKREAVARVSIPLLSLVPPE